MQLHYPKVCAGRGGAKRSASDARKALKKQVRAKLKRLIGLGCVVRLGGTHCPAQYAVTPRGRRRIQADLRLHERPAEQAHAEQAHAQTATSPQQQRPQQAERAALVTELVAALQPTFDRILAEMRELRALIGRGCVEEQAASAVFEL